MPTAAVAADGTAPVKKRRRRKKSDASEKFSVEARLQPRSTTPLGPLCWRLASRLATAGMRGRAHAAASDGLPELLRRHRVACTRASLDVRMRQRELHRRLLWAFDAIGARGQPAEVALRALYNHGPTSTPTSDQSARAVVVGPELPSEEQQRLLKLEQAWSECAPELRLDFEHWLKAEADGAVRAHFDQQEHFSRRRDAPSKAHERAGLCCRNHICLVAWFVVAFGLFIWLGVVQPENSSISFKPDKTELLRLHTLAKADAIANTNTSSTACVISPFHLADELEVEVPWLWYALYTALVIAEAVCIAIMYSFLHNNVDFLLLRVVLRSAQVRALGLQLFILVVHKVIQLAVLVPLFGPFYLLTFDRIIAYVCMCALVVVTDAQRQKHPLTRRVLVSIVFFVTVFSALERTFRAPDSSINLQDWIDVFALFPTHLCEKLDQTYILATAETSTMVSLVFTLAPAFRLIISDPEKVVFVKFIHGHSEVVAIHRACEFAARQRKDAKLEVSRWRRQKLSRASSVSSRLSAMSSGRISSVVY